MRDFADCGERVDIAIPPAPTWAALTGEARGAEVKKRAASTPYARAEFQYWQYWRHEAWTQSAFSDEEKSLVLPSSGIATH